jgi:hypothetical protein
MHPDRKLFEPPTRELIEELTSKMPDVEAAKHLGIAMVSFWKYRKQFKIKSYFERTGLRARKGTGDLYRFHQYDERFFENIDTPEKAYFLGLVAADGNISPRYTCCRIALKAVDQDILECFRKHLGPDAPMLRDKISTIDGVPCAPQKILALSRIAMVRDLMCWGIKPNKSRTLEIHCDALRNKRLCAAFLRGVWDGDGSVTERRFNLATGSPRFAEQMQEMVATISGCRLKLTADLGKNRKLVHKLSGYIKDARALHAIYAHPGPALERKKWAYELFWEPRR